MPVDKNVEISLTIIFLTQPIDTPQLGQQLHWPGPQADINMGDITSFDLAW